MSTPGRRWQVMIVGISRARLVRANARAIVQENARLQNRHPKKTQAISYWLSQEILDFGKRFTTSVRYPLGGAPVASASIRRASAQAAVPRRVNP